jgi:hypothetical protein
VHGPPAGSGSARRLEYVAAPAEESAGADRVSRARAAGMTATGSWRADWLRRSEEGHVLQSAFTAAMPPTGRRGRGAELSRGNWMFRTASVNTQPLRPARPSQPDAPDSQRFGGAASPEGAWTLEGTEGLDRAVDPRAGPGRGPAGLRVHEPWTRDRGAPCRGPCQRTDPRSRDAWGHWVVRGRRAPRPAGGPPGAGRTAHPGRHGFATKPGTKPGGCPVTPVSNGSRAVKQVRDVPLELQSAWQLSSAIPGAEYPAF